jgi:hypothetical protein
VLLVEGFDVLRVLGHKRWTDQMWEIQNGQFFWVISQSRWIVEDPCTLFARVLQKMGRIEVLHVKRWILSHQNGRKIFERMVDGFASGEPLRLGGEIQT